MEGCIADSVTRCWSYKVAQILPRVAQIVATAVLHEVAICKIAQKVINLFGLLLATKFGAKNFSKIDQSGHTCCDTRKIVFCYYFGIL